MSTVTVAKQTPRDHVTEALVNEYLASKRTLIFYSMKTSLTDEGCLSVVHRLVEGPSCGSIRSKVQLMFLMPKDWLDEEAGIPCINQAPAREQSPSRLHVDSWSVATVSC